MRRRGDFTKRGFVRAFDAVECPRCQGHGTLTVYRGAYYRTMRKRKGLSLREVARRLNISAAYLSDLELDRRAIREAIAERLDGVLA